MTPHSPHLGILALKVTATIEGEANVLRVTMHTATRVSLGMETQAMSGTVEQR